MSWKAGVEMNKDYIPLENIVELAAIGRADNPLPRHEILLRAAAINLPSAVEDKEKVALLLVDPQQDFMEQGSLGVPGSHADMARTINFIYQHLNKISQIFISLDHHDPYQIFHPCWWTDAAGGPVSPYTVIRAQDVAAGRWLAVYEPERSLQYVEALEREARKELVVWPYHCLQATTGAAMENQLANMVYFHAVARQSPPVRVQKGFDPLTEMYGIFGPEVGPASSINQQLLNQLAAYDRILVAGQAKSHCVLASIEQFTRHFAAEPEITSKLYLLEDCMSVIPGYEESTEAALAEFARLYKVNRITSVEI